MYREGTSGLNCHIREETILVGIENDFSSIFDTCRTIFSINIVRTRQIQAAICANYKLGTCFSSKYGIR